MSKYTPHYATSEVVAACIANLKRAPHPEVREVCDAAAVDLSDAAKARLRALLDQGKVTVNDLCVVVGEHGSTTPQAYPPLLVMVAQAHAITHDMCMTMCDDHEAACTGAYKDFVSYCNHMSVMMAALAGSYLLSNNSTEALDRRLRAWLDEHVGNECDDDGGYDVLADIYDVLADIIEHGNDLQQLYKGTDKIPRKLPLTDNVMLELMHRLDAELGGAGHAAGGCRCGGACSGGANATAPAPAPASAATGGCRCAGAVGTCGCPTGHDGVEGKPGKD